MDRKWLLFLVICSVYCADEKVDDALIKDVFGIGGDKDVRDKEAAIASVFGNGTQQKVPTPSLNPMLSGNSGSKTCECVAYYLCKDGNIIKDGTGIIDIRIDENQGDNPCSSYFDMCCESSDRTEIPITPAPPPQKPTGCGRRNPDGVGFRITGDKDNESQFGEFPWMVAILKEEAIEGNSQKLNIYQCGGALVHPQAVVTAAHCVSGKEPSSLKIRAGEWDTQTKKEIYPHQDRSVSSFKIHPQYYAGALFNDIAILFLESPVDIAENVDVVCLPPQDTVVANRARCLASGWGKDVFGKEGKYQVILKKVDLPIVARPTCQDQLRTTRLGKHFELHESFICAGGEPGKDTCKGDGGSPLVCPIEGQEDRYFHAGIVAWGIGCGDNNIPGVYVNVAKFRNWLDEQMAFNNLDTKFYQY